MKRNLQNGDSDTNLDTHNEDSKDASMIPVVAMLPQRVRQRCCLNHRLGRVKLYLPREDVVNGAANGSVADFREAVRSRLVWLYPELEQRHLLRAGDTFDMSVNGVDLVSATQLLQPLLDTVGNNNNKNSTMTSSSSLSSSSGSNGNMSVFYVQVIPHNVPPPKLPLSQRVTDAQLVTQEVQKQQDDNLPYDVVMISFYKFATVQNPTACVATLQRTWGWLGVKGRVYVATEGINAQLAVPQVQWDRFVEAMNGSWHEQNDPVIPPEFHNVFLNVDRIITVNDGLADDGAADNDGVNRGDALPFTKLHVRAREKVLADGLDLLDMNTDMQQQDSNSSLASSTTLAWDTCNGQEVSAMDWHKLLLNNKEFLPAESNNDTDDNTEKGSDTKEDKNKAIILDCRNDYESSVGRFDGAEPLNTRVFRDSWAVLEERLRDEPRDTPILTYCTGGIRCAKVNAFLEQRLGFNNTARLKGGIVAYTNTLRANGILDQSLFKGVNHVFDGRMGEVVTDDLLHRCVNCNCSCNVQTDCANVKCPRPFDQRIFVQCAVCTRRLGGACSLECCNALASASSTSTLTSTPSVSATSQLTNKIDGDVNENFNSLNVVPASTASDTTTSADKRSSSFTAGAASRERQQKKPRASAVNDDGNNKNSKSEKINHYVKDDDARGAYATAFSMPQPAHIQQVHDVVHRLYPERAHIMSSVNQAQFLKMLIEISGSRSVLELGTFVGYATLYMALGMTSTKDGLTSPLHDTDFLVNEIVTCEHDDKMADVAQAFFDDRPPAFDDSHVRIQLMRGNAAQSLAMLADQGRTFDFVFVDANKSGYVDYVTTLLDRDLVRVGGLVVADNVLFKNEVPAVWTEEQELLLQQEGSQVASENEENRIDERERRHQQQQQQQDLYRKRLGNVRNVRNIATHLHAFNRYMKKETRLEQVILELRDGLTISRRIS